MDTKTLAVTLVLLLALLSLLGGMVAVRRRDPALTIWAVGLLGSAFGFALVLVQGLYPSPWLLLLSNLLIASYSVALPVGLRSFLGLQPAWRWSSTVGLALWLALMLFFIVVEPSYTGRVTVVSLYLSWLALEFLWLLGRPGRVVPRGLKIVLGAVALIYALFHGFRASVVHWSVAPSVLEDNWLTSLTFLVSMAVALLWSGGLLLLDSHRLRSMLEADAVELRRLNLLKDRVLAMTGHDLRGPLGNLRLIWGELGSRVRDGKGFDFDPELLTLVDRSLAGTQDLLENLFSFAEAQGLGADPDQRAVLSVAVGGAADLWTAAARLKDIEVVNEGGDAPLVCANQDAVAAVLRNLVSNAIKFTPPGGRVTLRIGDDAAGPFVEVADTGVGIDLERLARAEGLAAKASRTGTAGERGSGFGLVLVRELVEGWGGTLTFETAPGAGTKVRVGFPRET